MAITVEQLERNLETLKDSPNFELFQLSLDSIKQFEKDKKQPTPQRKRTNLRLKKPTLNTK